MTKQELKTAYSGVSDNELLNIIKSENGYTDIAKEVAQEKATKRNLSIEVLSNDFERKQEQEKEIKKNKKKLIR